MRNLLRQNNKIIVNADIDGILSAYVLCRYHGCEIVGFSNSADCVWWRGDRIRSIYDAVFVDMFVSHRDVPTIDQHIVAYDPETLTELKELGNKLNPNIDNARTFLPNGSYYSKYPFGTVHYILAKLGSDNIDVKLDTARPVCAGDGHGLTVADFILRADDAMTTSLKSNYTANAKRWWWWLKDVSKMSNNIVSLTSYLNECVLNGVDALAKKDFIGKFLVGSFNCNSPDGGFSNVVNKDGSLRECFTRFVKFVFSLFHDTVSCDFLNARYETSVGKTNRISMTQDAASELMHRGTINGEEVFSFGYVRSSTKPNNFSYTVM